MISRLNLVFIVFALCFSKLVLAQTIYDSPDDDEEVEDLLQDGSVKEKKTKTILREHEHDDLFAEQEIFFGFKAGPQVSGYTSYKVGTGEVNVQSSFRLAGGLASEFVYHFLRVELDLFWNYRGSLNQGKSLHSFAVPALVKLPWHLNSFLDLEAGLGGQVDLPFTGYQPRRSVLMSGLASLGLLVDFTEGDQPSTSSIHDVIFCFESRFVMGLQHVSPALNGANPREFQLLLGMLWHY